MRFTAGGPSLPDDLLYERDEGRVVFLCGAGVSIPYGLPTFLDLTQFVIDRLSPAANSDIRKAFAPWLTDVPDSAKTPLDQIFNLLQLEFGREEIGELVAERLKTTREKASREHQIISRISAGQDGVAQIVTTNFDHLFEHADPTGELKLYVPPTFPDLKHDVPVSGITYLHGRVPSASKVAHDYVLSSSDFGRAYLARGWATAFVRQLLQRYTVVLLGYQAEDPPVKYLLQGLSQGSDHLRHKLYAFDQGAEDEIEVKWRDRGVKPIAYAPSLRHRSLWDTLEAWADRANSPSAWMASVVGLSRQGPSSLEPYQRGMVAHIARTTQGTRQLADATPTPPLEWLFTFDRGCRLAKWQPHFFEQQEAHDSAQSFGLDDDPLEQDEAATDTRPIADDLIAWRNGDDSVDRALRLSLAQRPEDSYMPSRLFNLSRWIVHHAKHPALAWWVAKQRHLHPRLRENLRNQIRASEGLTTDAMALWDILLEVQMMGDLRPQDSEWFDLLRQVKDGRWTPSMFRQLESATEPRFSVTLPRGHRAVVPPGGDWADAGWVDIAQIDVKFPALHGDKPAFDDASVLRGFEVLEANLVRASERLQQAKKTWFRLATLYPEAMARGHVHAEDKDAFVRWFVELLDRLTLLNPAVLRARVDGWPTAGKVFDKLRLYAWAKQALFSGAEVYERITTFHDAAFWSGDDERELLFLLRERWKDFVPAHREAIAARILTGPAHLLVDNDPTREAMAKRVAATYLGWLDSEGCELPEGTKKLWRALVATIPDYQDTWALHAAKSNEARVGWVATVADPAALLTCPITDVVDLALQLGGERNRDFEEHRPFLGLVKQHPARAVRALRAKARRGDFPAEPWKEAIDNWPEGAAPRATLLLHHMMRSLPTEFMVQLRHTFAGWLRGGFHRLVLLDEVLAYQIYDQFVQAVMAAGEDATTSAMGEIRQAGRVVARSRRTQEYATNSPVGMAMEAIIVDLDRLKVVAGATLPGEFKFRANRLLASPGEGRDHAVSIITSNAVQLDAIDEHWVTETVLPWFELQHPNSEAAWSGFITSSNCVPNPILAKVKEAFLTLFPGIYAWGWEDAATDKAHGWVVVATVFAAADRPGLSFSEARDCLRNMRATALARVIWVLQHVGTANDNGWESFVVPFIEKSWPRELRYRTAKNSSAWVSLLGDSGQEFPKVLPAVRRFLRPIASSHHGLYRFYRLEGEGAALSQIFPNETLDVLDLTISANPAEAPYELKSVLDALIESAPPIVGDSRYRRLREIEQRR